MKKPNLFIVFTITLILVVLLISLSSPPYEYFDKDQSVLKIAFQHAGDRISGFNERVYLKKQAEIYRDSIRNKKGVRMSMKISEKNYARERYPVFVKITIDNKILMEKNYIPTGSNRDSDSMIYESFKVSPGHHQIEIEMKDSFKQDKPPYMFKDNVKFEDSEIKIVDFNRISKKLYWSKRHKQKDVRHSSN